MQRENGSGPLSPYDFLVQLHPDRPWALTSILDKAIQTCNDRAKAEGWIAEANGHRNLYYNPNEVPAGLKGRASKEHIIAAHYIHVDIDPREGVDIAQEQQRIRTMLSAFPLAPSVIVFSGGGYNLLWSLKEPVLLKGNQERDRVEAVNKNLERWFGSKDGCYNVDRILRLPGTLNVLNEKKRRDGRAPAMAHVVAENWNRRYSIDELEAWPPLPEQAKAWLGPLLITGQSPECDEPYESRSDAVWAAACELARSGAADEEATALLLDKRLAISAHVYDQSNPERYAAKQIKNAQKEVEKEEERGRPSHAYLLMQIGGEATLFRTPMKEAYAAWTYDGHRECAPVDSSAFQTYLRTEFRKRKDGALPASEAMKAAVLALSDDARRGEEHRVFLRVAGLGSKIYIDMGDDAWRAIEIDESGWRVVSQPHVFFRRMPGMKALPEPMPGGKIGDIRQFLNWSSKEDLYLTIGFLLGCLQPETDGPYPILVLYGEHGSAKSTFATVLVGLIDPKVAMVLGRPKSKIDLIINARENFMLAFNNLSHVTEEMSDVLCQLSDGGGGDAPRKLYTQESIIFNDHRPVILNGIPDVVTRPDLADRSIKLMLEPIAEESYRPDDEVNAAFEAAKPELLGALLAMISTGLRNLPTMPALKVPTRMARFTRWVAACSQGVFSDGAFMEAYLENRIEAGRQMIADDPLAAALVRLVAAEPEYLGSASDLLFKLEVLAGIDRIKPKGWPQLPQNLSTKLRRFAPILRRDGIEIELDVRVHRDNKRGIRITKRTV